VIDTGLVSAIPPLPGLADVPYLTSSSIMELEEVPEHLVVLGGGYVGLEFAQMFHRFGSRVTVLQRDAQLLPREDQDVADEVASILRADGIDVRLGIQAREVRQANGEIELSCAPGSAASDCRVQGTHLLVATGRVPNTETLNLAAGGVDVDAKGFVRVNARLETSSPGVFALGDVTGGPAFTHVSYDDYRILRTNLLEGGQASTEGRILPYTVFMDPQLGRVGMTEREALASGRRIRVAKLPMTRVARALEVDETRGFMKAVVDADSGSILGAAVLGLEGGEIAALLQLAMMGGLPYTRLRDGMFSHPTLAEALNNLFMALDRGS
jgi:pyruvate/2-oxoglutarate dehydrogenase complex dihydrolipoamide dehydrogenase (E3) component